MLSKQKRMPRFSKKDVVDVRLPSSKIGDWEQGEIMEVRNYNSGAVYKVKTFSGETVTVEEDDLRLADK